MLEAIHSIPRSLRATRLLCWLACASLAVSLAGCGGDGSSDSGASSGPPASSTTSSVSPSIHLTGTPAASVEVGSTYTFQPTVSATTGTPTFAITGMPSWATFDSATGKLSGTPSASDVGTTGSISITASDGGASASVGPFTIDVVASSSSPATGSVTLSWAAPTENTDGTPVTDLAGYYIHYGTSSSALTQTITVVGATTTSFEISNLTAGTYYFSIAAYNSLGAESTPTGVVSKTI